MYNRNKNKGIIILGKGGHAKDIADVVNSIKTYSISFGGSIPIEDMIDWNKDTKIITGKKYIVGFGALDNQQLRQDCFNAILIGGGIPATVISPHAIVSPNCKIDVGTIVMPGAIIQPGAYIGKNCIINTGAIVEHDAMIGHNCHISTGTVINGNCTIFDGCLIGSRAVVKQGIKIWRKNIIGAGAVVVKNISGSGKTYIGCPACEMKYE